MFGLLVESGKGLAALAIVAFIVAQVIASLPTVSGFNAINLTAALQTVMAWANTLVPLIVVIGLGQWIGVFGGRR